MPAGSGVEKMVKCSIGNWRAFDSCPEFAYAEGDPVVGVLEDKRLQERG